MNLFFSMNSKVSSHHTLISAVSCLNHNFYAEFFKTCYNLFYDREANILNNLLN